MQSNNSTSYADLFGALMAVFMFVSVVLGLVVSPEVLTYMERTKTEKIQDSSAPVISERVDLTVTRKPEGIPQYQLRMPSGELKKTDQYDQVITWIRIERPQDLSIRIDRRTEVGVYSDLLLDAGGLGIKVWQNDQRK